MNGLADAVRLALVLAVLYAAMAALAWRFAALGWSPWWMAAGLAVNAVSHGWADHRPNLRALAVRLGKRGYWDDVPGGAYQLDQAWHLGWLAVSAVVIAT